MSQSGGSGGGGGSQDPSSSQPGSQRKIQYTQLEEDMIRDALKVGLTINQPNQIARFIYTSTKLRHRKTSRAPSTVEIST